MNKEQLISEMLLLPAAAIDYHISQHLLQLFPDKAFIESEGYLNVEVQWQGHTLDVLILHIQGEAFQKSHFWLLADIEEIARSFFAAVSRWDAEIRGEVLVFDNGCWYKDEYLFQDIRYATFDNLILRGSLKQEILDDLVQFFAARTLYEEHDVPWKRGILFVGPAGNGKTHTVKALINSLEQPCLYVKSFRAPHTQDVDEFNIRQVFARARRTAPCVLVLEDLDSLLTPHNRSFFLNELDGFASNIGIVTLSTTNHPERLDPAILDRPSRFDRKYPFDLPELPERSAYKMRWIAHPQQGTMEQVMSEQVGKLREQMLSVNMLPAPELPEELEGMPPMFGPMMARGMRFQHRRQS